MLCCFNPWGVETYSHNASQLSPLYWLLHGQKSITTIKWKCHIRCMKVWVPRHTFSENTEGLDLVKGLDLVNGLWLHIWTTSLGLGYVSLRMCCMLTSASTPSLTPDPSDGYHINNSHPFHMEVGNCQQVLYTFTTPCVSAWLLENMGTNANLSFAIWHLFWSHHFIQPVSTHLSPCY